MNGHECKPTVIGSNGQPLVVIDPEDRETVGRVLAHYWHSDDPYSEDMYPEYLTDLQAALRSLIEPPKPEEPTGLGAVVEDAEGKRYYRGGPALADMHWRSAEPLDNSVRKWSAVPAVRVLSEGVVA